MVEQILRAIRRCRELLKEAKTRPDGNYGNRIPLKFFFTGPFKSEGAGRNLSEISANVVLKEHQYVRSVTLSDTQRPISHGFKGKTFVLDFAGPYYEKVGVSSAFFDAIKAMGYSIAVEELPDYPGANHFVARLKWKGKPVAKLAKSNFYLALYSKPGHVEKLVRALFTLQLPGAAARKQLSAPRRK